MNIIVFGASGRTGRELVARALDEGHAVTAFVRDPSKLAIEHPNLTIEQGSVTDYAAIDKVLQARRYDAACNALGAKSMFKRDRQLIEALSLIIRALENNGVPRLLHISFVGVRQDAGKLGWSYRYVIPMVMTNLLRDHKDKEELLRHSHLQWVAVQPPVLTSGPFTGAYVHEADIHADRPYSLKLSRSNLADFMVKQLREPAYRNQTVFVTE